MTGRPKQPLSQRRAICAELKKTVIAGLLERPGSFELIRADFKDPGVEMVLITPRNGREQHRLRLNIIYDGLEQPRPKPISD